MWPESYGDGSDDGPLWLKGVERGETGLKGVEHPQMVLEGFSGVNLTYLDSFVFI